MNIEVSPQEIKEAIERINRIGFSDPTVQADWSRCSDKFKALYARAEVRWRKLKARMESSPVKAPLPPPRRMSRQEKEDSKYNRAEYNKSRPFWSKTP